MNPLLSLVLAEIVKQAPVLAIELLQILSQPGVTDEDWDKLKARYTGRTYEDYIAAAAQAPASAALNQGGQAPAR
jgi:hypothetical protein